MWIPAFELGHQASVASVPTTWAICLAPELILYSLWGPVTIDDQYVFQNKDSDLVPFPVCTKFLSCENTQIVLPSYNGKVVSTGKCEAKYKEFLQVLTLQTGTNKQFTKLTTKTHFVFYYVYTTLNIKKGVNILSF